MWGGVGGACEDMFHKAIAATLRKSLPLEDIIKYTLKDAAKPTAVSYIVRKRFSSKDSKDFSRSNFDCLCHCLPSPHFHSRIRISLIEFESSIHRGARRPIHFPYHLPRPMHPSSSPSSSSSSGIALWRQSFYELRVEAARNTRAANYGARAGGGNPSSPLSSLRILYIIRIPFVIPHFPCSLLSPLNLFYLCVHDCRSWSLLFPPAEICANTALAASKLLPSSGDVPPAEERASDLAAIGAGLIDCDSGGAPPHAAFARLLLLAGKTPILRPVLAWAIRRLNAAAQGEQGDSEGEKLTVLSCFSRLVSEREFPDSTPAEKLALVDALLPLCRGGRPSSPSPPLRRHATSALCTALPWTVQQDLQPSGGGPSVVGAASGELLLLHRVPSIVGTLCGPLADDTNTELSRAALAALQALLCIAERARGKAPKEAESPLALAIGQHVPMLIPILQRYLLAPQSAVRGPSGSEGGVGNGGVFAEEGRSAAPFPPVAASSASASAGYVPPHARGRPPPAPPPSSSNAAAGGAAPLRGGRESSSPGGSMDGEGGAATASSPRILALSCLTSLLRCCGRACLPQWPNLLPTEAACDPHPRTPTLVTSLLFDRSFRARASAAAAIAATFESAGARPHMAAAELLPAPSPSSPSSATLSTSVATRAGRRVAGTLPVSFTSLSTTLPASCRR